MWDSLKYIMFIGIVTNLGCQYASDLFLGSAFWGLIPGLWLNYLVGTKYELIKRLATGQI